MSPERCAATSIAPRPTGSTSAFSAPTAVRIATGCPTTRNTAVETTMKPTMSCGARRSNPGLSVRTNDTEVYADPTTDVAAAAHIPALGVGAHGGALDRGNPAASVFRLGGIA